MLYVERKTLAKLMGEGDRANPKRANIFLESPDDNPDRSALRFELNGGENGNLS